MNKKLINYFQLFLTIVLVVFIISKAGDFLERVDWQAVLNSWPFILISAALFVCGYIILANHWLAVCRIIEPKASSKQTLAFFASQPYKYLPTSIFTFSSRATFAAKFGLGIKQSTQAQVIENFNLISSAIVSGGLLLLFRFNFWYGVVALAIITIACIVIWHQRSVKIPFIKYNLDLQKWLKSLSIVTLGWLIIGFGFFVMTVGIEGRFEPILAVAASDLATGLGILAVFAPGGIGVRELVFHYLSFASGTILIWRLTTFMVDIVIGIWAGWTISRRQ
ncbi:MAG: hypothetical protein Q7T74_03940 [Candidatus Saccharibacteria bacterium]|nr:hypothetical protein [Candidatus Saccharibacteria bacterium]